MPVETRGATSSARAYEALRLCFFPWQRERRLGKVRERAQEAARHSRPLSSRYWHSLLLRRNGSVACWGDNGEGQAPPDGVDGDFVAIAAGWMYSIALRPDGSVACWGWNNDGQAPPDGVAGPFGHV